VHSQVKTLSCFLNSLHLLIHCLQSHLINSKVGFRILFCLGLSYHYLFLLLLEVFHTQSQGNYDMARIYVELSFLLYFLESDFRLSQEGTFQ